MAKIEFILKRIESSKSNIEKLEKKLARIQKAAESNYETNNPYYYSDYDLRVTTKDLASARANLAKYEAQLEELNTKAASRNVTVILDFLNNWKNNVSEFYHRSLPKYIDRLNKYYEASGNASAYYNKTYYLERQTEEFKAAYKLLKEEENKARTARAALNFLDPYVEITRNYTEVNGYTYISVASCTINESKLKKDLDYEAELKYDDLIDRVQKITGKITDASNLHIGDKGDIDGIIIGEKGKAKVNTIGAGGYAVQCYHFRTLVHPIN